MNNWLDWYWPLMLIVVIPFLLFGVPEWIALKTGGRTFSRFMHNVGSGYGFWSKVWFFAWGLLIGALFVHFNGWCVQ